ncbi:MAG: sulfatase [Planctomycetaceae bacterium]|nr:sulfatase [Planctomycetaceae bacterium]
MSHYASPISRRDFLTRYGGGTGLLGLGSLLASQSSARAASPHFAPKAKRIIHLLMNGGPSHIDTFDPKPLLAKYDGQRPAAVDLRTQRATAGILKSPFKFAQHGQSGLWVSDLFPHVARHADELCVIRSMHTDIPEHVSGLLMLDIGANQPNRPSMGSWITYGLGTENEDLPGFVVLSHRGHPRPGPTSWSNSFLPGPSAGAFVDTYQMKPDKVMRNLRNPHLTPSQQRRQLELLQRMNRLQVEGSERNQALESRIESLELAFRMQFAAPEAFDISRETQATLDLYGIGPEPTFFEAGQRKCGGFAEGALIARRLSERGVRVVQLAMAPDIPWDDHTDIRDHVPKAFECDRAIAALLTDLKVRGLLDETLILWGGEFGRTPTTDITAKKPGRDHNHYGFTVWMAGGGIKGGFAYGATDEFGMRAVENRMHVHDLHATILHLMGLDHERLTFRHSGRDFRLTDIEGKVANAIIA